MLLTAWTAEAQPVLEPSAAGGVSAERPPQSTPIAQSPADPLATPETSIEPAADFFEALRSGTVRLNVRGRHEYVEQDDLGNQSNATTVRTRLGYLTGDFLGFQAFVELEDVRAARDELYNAAGLNGVTGRPVVADPEVTELNELWLGYTLPGEAGERAPGLNVKVGRQTINLDDQRFVGAVEWRQDNQTFDAGTFTSDFGLAGFEFFYGYLDQINRVFGEERDFESDSHLLNASYEIARVGKLTGFAYLLDFENSPANSSETYGLRLAGGVPLREDVKLLYQVSWATQSEFGDNPADYTAGYLLGDVAVEVKGIGTLGAGYERLGSDEGVSFQTPLATLHKFNGFADQFLVTPAEGLEDFYIYAKAGFLPKNTSALVAWHIFSADEGGGEFGTEFDAVITQKLHANLTAGAKFAYFMGDDGRPDVSKVVVDLTLSF